jgi:hypothetical protein
MRTAFRVAVFVVATVGFATDATAQERSEIATAIDTAPGSAADKTESSMEAGAFEKLSAANQKLAEAIFGGQKVTAAGSAPLNLDQIATIQRLGGWKLVFSQMKAKGLTVARNVRDLLAGAKGQRKAQASPSMMVRSRVTVVTNGAGHRAIFYARPAPAARPPVPPPPRKPMRDGAS